MSVHTCIYAGAEVRNMKRRKEHTAQDMFLCFSTEGISFSLVIPPYLKQNNSTGLIFSANTHSFLHYMFNVSARAYSLTRINASYSRNLIISKQL